MANGKNFTVVMEADLVRALGQRAKEEGCSRSHIIGKLCKNFLSEGAMHQYVKPVRDSGGKAGAMGSNDAAPPRIVPKVGRIVLFPTGRVRREAAQERRLREAQERGMRRKIRRRA